MFNINIPRITPSVKMVDLIEKNPSFLLFMQHFQIDFRVGDLTVSQVCEKYGISEKLFVSVGNLYNGATPRKEDSLSSDEMLQVIQFLRNSHSYYREYIYPEIESYIHQLQENSSSKELLLLEKFFNTYFKEVLEHLDYEDNVAFPYFTKLATKRDISCEEKYSSKDYHEHHTDIELKLTDLKNLLLKHIKIEGSVNLQRRLLSALSELEFDLYIHSVVEESILVPSGRYLERDCK